MPSKKLLGIVLRHYANDRRHVKSSHIKVMAYAKAVYYYLALSYCNETQKEIASNVDRNSPAVVPNGYRSIKALLSVDKKAKAEISILIKKLKENIF